MYVCMYVCIMYVFRHHKKMFEKQIKKSGNDWILHNKIVK